MKLNVLVAYICALIGLISCKNIGLEIDDDVDNALDKPTDSGKPFAESAAFAEGMEWLKNRCDASPKGAAAFTELVDGAQTFLMCLLEYAGAELEELKKIFESDNGTKQDEVLTIAKSYCSNRNVAIECFNNFEKTLHPCLAPKEIEVETKVVQTAIKSFDFICEKDGERIGLFVNSNGPECIREQKTQIDKCADGIFDKYSLEKSNGTFPFAELAANLCHDTIAEQTCVVKQLEKCENRTAAQLFDSMYSYVRAEVLCK